DSELLPKRGDMLVSRRLRDVNRAEVEGVREREAVGDGPVVLLFVVLGRPDLFVEFEGYLLVERDGGRRDVGAPFGDRLLERRQVNERYEDRSRLPARHDGAVVLRLVAGASADERQDFAGAWIERDERRFGLAALPFGEHRIDVREPLADGVLRE